VTRAAATLWEITVFGERARPLPSRSAEDLHREAVVTPGAGRLHDDRGARELHDPARDPGGGPGRLLREPAGVHARRAQADSSKTPGPRSRRSNARSGWPGTPREPDRPACGSELQDPFASRPTRRSRSMATSTVRARASGLYCLDGDLLRRTHAVVTNSSAYTCASGDILAQNVNDLRFAYYGRRQHSGPQSARHGVCARRASSRRGAGHDGGPHSVARCGESWSRSRREATRSVRGSRISR